MAFGKIGLDRNTFWEMTPKEFFNAWIGYSDKREEEFNVLFYTAKYNALRTAMSEKQAKQIQRDKPPWDRQPEGVDVDDKIEAFLTMQNMKNKHGER